MATDKNPNGSCKGCGGGINGFECICLKSDFEFSLYEESELPEMEVNIVYTYYPVIKRPDNQEVTDFLALDEKETYIVDYTTCKRYAMHDLPHKHNQLLSKIFPIPTGIQRSDKRFEVVAEKWVLFKNGEFVAFVYEKDCAINYIATGEVINGFKTTPDYFELDEVINQQQEKQP